MSKKVQIYFKDPDALFEAGLTEKKREEISEKYSEFSEYFTIEIDFATKTGKLLPKSEWKR